MGKLHVKVFYEWFLYGYNNEIDCSLLIIWAGLMYVTLSLVHLVVPSGDNVHGLPVVDGQSESYYGL